MTDADANDALPEPEATTPEPAAAAPPATETPEPAAAATPTTPTPATETPAADAAPIVEAPAAAATAEHPTATAPMAAVPVAPAATEPPKPAGIHVPVWVAAVVGALVVFALGLGIGYAVGDHHDEGDRTVGAVPGPNGGRYGRMPFGGNGQMPFGNGGQFGNGNGQMPFGGNGNDRNGNGGNGSNGGSTTARVFLGVAAQDSGNPDGAELVRVVAGSPAADAGLKTGDVITKFDGTTIAGSSDLTAAVRAQQAGDEVTITYVRNGQTDTTQATLAGSSEFSRQ